MALWEDITKGAKDAAAFTMKKTEEITNVAKLKLAIHSEDSKLDKCFGEIGFLYYSYQRKGEDHSSEIAALLMEADELSVKIDLLRAELAKLQKGIICKGCGAQVTSDYDFCPLCGEKLNKTEEKAENTDTDDKAE